MQLGQYPQAIQDLDEAIQLDPQYSLAYNNRGVYYTNLGQLDQALRDYEEAIRLNPQYGGAYANRAIVYTLLDADTRAKQDVVRALEHGTDAAFINDAIDQIRRQR